MLPLGDAEGMFGSDDMTYRRLEAKTDIWYKVWLSDVPWERQTFPQSPLQAIH